MCVWPLCRWTVWAKGYVLEEVGRSLSGMVCGNCCNGLGSAQLRVCMNDGYDNDNGIMNKFMGLRVWMLHGARTSSWVFVESLLNSYRGISMRKKKETENTQEERYTERGRARRKRWTHRKRVQGRKMEREEDKYIQQERKVKGMKQIWTARDKHIWPDPHLHAHLDPHPHAHRHLTPKSSSTFPRIYTSTTTQTVLNPPSFPAAELTHEQTHAIHTPHNLIC